MPDTWKLKEREVAAYLSSHPAWPYGPCVRAASLSGGLNTGEDILRADGGRLPVSIEVKYGHERATMQRLADWLEQAHGQSAGRPFVVIHAEKYRQVRNFDCYTPWDLSSPATGWWSTPLAFWVQQQPFYSAGLEF